MQGQNFGGSEASSPNLSKKIKNFVFSQKDQIGKGYSSVVYRGIDDVTKEDIAVKVVELNKIKNEVQRHLLNNEMRALRKLQHPHILRCLDILMTKNNIYIVTEFCRTGDMVGLIRQNGRLPELQALTYLKEIAEGYVFIEENGILHRDLKTANIFLNGGSTRIADFGFCEFVGEPRPSIVYNVGSPAYMSPESYRQSYYSNKSDVWSIGIIFYEMLMGEVPFKKSEYVELAQNLTSGNLGIPQEANVSDTSRSILIECFRQKISERLEPKRLLQMVDTQLKRRYIQKLTLVQAQTLRSSFDMSASPPLQQHIDTQRNLPSGGLPNRLHQQPPPYHLSSVILNGQKFITSPQKNLDFSQVQIQSEVAQQKADTQMARQHIEYIVFLYRLSKICLESVNIVPLDQYINNILLIVVTNRSFVYTEIEPLLVACDSDSNRQFQYLRSQFEELGLVVEQLESVDQNIKNLLTSTPFRSEGSLRLCLSQLKASIAQVDRQMDQNIQVVGVLMDYLMIYHELLAVQMVGANVTEVVRISHLTEILKDKPKTLSQIHVRLLRFKRKLLNL